MLRIIRYVNIYDTIRRLHYAAYSPRVDPPRVDPPHVRPKCGIRPNFWDDPPQVLGRSAPIKLHQTWTEVGINDDAP